MEDQKINEHKELKDQFPVTFRRWLAREIESGKISAKEALVRFNLDYNIRTIERWVDLYSLGKEISLASMTPKEKLEKAALEKRIKDLEKSLEYACFKNIAIETMIDVAEEQFRISIRKKAGPKQ